MMLILYIRYSRLFVIRISIVQSLVIFQINMHFTDHANICKTISGPSSNKPCIFPFKFRGDIHNDCNWDGDSSGGAWCSTLIDDSGQHVGGKGNWGNCGPKCPIPPNPIQSTSTVISSSTTTTTETSTTMVKTKGNYIELKSLCPVLIFVVIERTKQRCIISLI